MGDGIIILILLALVFLFIIGAICHAVDVSNKAQADEARRRRMKEEEEHQQREIDFENKIQSLKEKFGELSIEIGLKGSRLNWDDIGSRIFIFENAQTALIEGQPIAFKKILAYTLTDNKQTISTTRGTANTETSLGSMAGRALVGGVLLGGVGALAGATTAKKDTEVSTTTNHTTKHDYIIYLNIDDIADPQRILKFGSDAEMANKAASVFNVIISRNNTEK